MDESKVDLDKDKKPARKLNRVEQQISDAGNCRSLYPRGGFVWFIGGDCQGDPNLESQMRYRIMRDFEALTRIIRAKQLQPVALLNDKNAAPLARAMLPKFYQWGAVNFGEGELNIANHIQVCAMSCDILISYGEPSDVVDEILLEREDEPVIIRREIQIPRKQHMPLKQQGDPYAGYKADCNRLRNWQPMPTKGLQMRDMIDIRPVFGI